MKPPSFCLILPLNPNFPEMKNCILLFAFTFLIGFSAFARKVDPETAKEAAKNFYSVNAISAQGSNIQEIKLQLIYAENFSSGTYQVDLFYIFNVNENDGFVIISADDIVTPILGYSDEGAFSMSQISPEFKFWMDGFSNQILYAIDNDLKADELTKLKWTELFHPELKSSSKTSTSVAPLLTTRWDQGGYYNDLCPGGSVTGCVATAMAQILKFWNYPETGTGSKTYSPENYGPQTADFGNTHYNWTNMPNTVTAPNLDVATLMFHCGVAVSMHYSPSASGAMVTLLDGSVCAESAFKANFGYDIWTMQGLRRNHYSNSDWNDLLKNELDDARPIQYVGRGVDGHTWVCDGYDANSLFHMNWGWGGYANGYFNLNSLNPGGSSFNDAQQALIGIQPMNFVTATTQEKLFSLHLWPNPAKENIQISIPGNPIAGEIRIMNVFGQVVESRSGISAPAIFDISNFTPGFYLVELVRADKKYHSRFLVTR